MTVTVQLISVINSHIIAHFLVNGDSAQDLAVKPGARVPYSVVSCRDRAILRVPRTCSSSNRKPVPWDQHLPDPGPSQCSFQLQVQLPAFYCRFPMSELASAGGLVSSRLPPGPRLVAARHAHRVAKARAGDRVTATVQRGRSCLTPQAPWLVPSRDCAHVPCPHRQGGAAATRAGRAR